MIGRYKCTTIYIAAIWIIQFHFNILRTVLERSDYRVASRISIGYFIPYVIIIVISVKNTLALILIWLIVTSLAKRLFFGSICCLSVCLLAGLLLLKITPFSTLLRRATWLSAWLHSHSQNTGRDYLGGGDCPFSYFKEGTYVMTF